MGPSRIFSAYNIRFEISVCLWVTDSRGTWYTRNVTASYFKINLNFFQRPHPNLVSLGPTLPLTCSSSSHQEVVNFSRVVRDTQVLGGPQVLGSRCYSETFTVIATLGAVLPPEEAWWTLLAASSPPPPAQWCSSGFVQENLGSNRPPVHQYHCLGTPQCSVFAPSLTPRGHSPRASPHDAWSILDWFSLLKKKFALK